MSSCELQFSRRGIELSLEVAHPRCIVLLGSFDARMAQQFLNCAEIHAGLQQFDAEGIAKPMRMGVDPGHAGKAGDRAPGAADCGAEQRGPTPEEVVALDGNLPQSFQCYIRQSDVKRLARLLHADHKPAFVVDPTALKFHGVADAHAGIEQQQYEGAGADPGSLDSDVVIVADLIARGEQGFDLIRVEGKRGQRIVFGWLDFAGGVYLQPFAFNTELTERPKVLDLFSQCPRAGELAAAPFGFGARGREVADRFHIELGDVGQLAEPPEVVERPLVSVRGRGAEMPSPAVPQIALDGSGNRGVLLRRRIDGSLIGFPPVEQSLGSGPVASADRSAHPIAGGRVGAVDPYGAAALSEHNTIGLVRAGFYVATIELKRQKARVPRIVRVLVRGWYTVFLVV